MTFRKMHGLGNDFVIIDGRGLDAVAAGLTTDAIRMIADRRRGLGCDQLIVIETSDKPEASAFVRILNNDGSEAEACGNATRCVADLLMDEAGSEGITLETIVGLLAAERHADGLITVDMGAPKLDWQSIPLSEEVDTEHLPLAVGPLHHGVAVNMGNPHAVHFVPDMDAVPLDRLGPVLENDALFPAKANIEAAQIIDRQTIRMRVWERAVGITQACGSAACATIVAAVKRDLTDRKVDMILDGGTLTLEWRESDDHVMMTGPVAYVAEGVIDPTMLGKPRVTNKPKPQLAVSA
ncbi:MAG: diaminopimelate epimerase [Pseudomonadota bacterium]